MKEIIAIIRLNKMQDTKDALASLGLPAFTAMRVFGRGAPVKNSPVSDLDPAIPPRTPMGPRLFPKRLLSLIVPDDMALSVVKAIMRANRTGGPGDGKIYLLPVAEVWRIRTGEKGSEAIL